MSKFKIVIIASLILFFISGCNKSSDKIKSAEELNNNIEEKTHETVDIDSLVFPLYRMTTDGYNYFYANNNIRITSSKIIIDNEKKQVIDLEKKELLDYDDYIANNPSNEIMNFILLRSECKNKVNCSPDGGCQIDNFGIQDLQEMIDPENGVTPDYLMYEWCPVNISDELISQINSLDGFKVWGKGLENTNDEITPLSIAIELPSGETYPSVKKLFDEYGLLNLFNTYPKKYANLRLSTYTCKEYDLKCENKD